MGRRILALCAAAMFTLAAGTAMADNIKGRAGVTGRIGFSIPSDGDAFGQNLSTDTGFTGGGGLIYGLTDNIAVDLEVNHATYGTGTIFAPGFGGSDFNTTDIAFGAQYRFLNLIGGMKQLVPYLGGGLDILINDSSTGGFNGVDNVVGIDFRGGVDYFIVKDLALTTEAKFIVAPDADIQGQAGNKVGNFDPDSFSMTVGVRYFFY